MEKEKKTLLQCTIYGGKKTTIEYTLRILCFFKKERVVRTGGGYVMFTRKRLFFREKPSRVSLLVTAEYCDLCIYLNISSSEAVCYKLWCFVDGIV